MSVLPVASDVLPFRVTLPVDVSNVPVEPAKLKFAPLVPDRLPVNVCAFGIVVASDTSVELLGELSTA